MTPSIWYRSDADAWQREALSGGAFTLRNEPLPVAAIVDLGSQSPDTAEIHGCQIGNRQTWVLLVPPQFGAWVSGREVRQLRVLRDRDSIWWPGIEPLYFSTEEPARVEPYQNDTTQCVRCHLPIELNQLAVRCPGCGLWHHEDASLERQCWTYHESCAGCRKHPTELSGDFLWRPEAA